MTVKFIPYIGDLGDLPTSKNHLNFKWLQSNCQILFSATKRGEAISCHFTSDKTGLRYLEEAINDWCEFCFWLFSWCEMLIGVIEKPSICRLAEKCGFSCILEIDGKSIYIRRR